MTKINDNLYGLNRRASSSENHVVPATNMAALFAFSEREVLAKAHRDFGLATDLGMAREILANQERRMAGGIASIRRVRNPKARTFLSDLDNLRIVPDEMFNAPKVAWMFGAVAGLAAVTALANMVGLASAHDERALADLVAALERHLEGAEHAWARHRAEILRDNPHVTGGDLVFELVMTDPEVPFYRIVVTAEEPS